MGQNLNVSFHESRAARLESEWQTLCSRYLPLHPKDSMWRYHRPRLADDPEQGWKLHISATVLNAVRVLRKSAPLLAERGVQFKAPASLKGVAKLNSGSSGGYTQVGKVITVYTRTAAETVRLARHLHKLTYRMNAPAVPFDLKYRCTSNVYYRFGAFRPQEIEPAAGTHVPAIRGPHGDLVQDRREHPKPDWVNDPFDGALRRDHSRTPNPRANSYGVFRALAQRGKGGVYQAVDFSVTPPRLCLIKEGRRHGEVTWDGRDGRWRARNEERVLTELRREGLDVPTVYSSFESEGNHYLITEFIDGESLQSLLARRRRRLSIAQVLDLGSQLATFFAQMHDAGWVWRDCKPMNLLVTPEGLLRPLDFEGACRVARPDGMLWGTPGFVPPEWWALERRTGLPDDLYALGSMLYLLTTGSVPEIAEWVRPERLRSNIPQELVELITELLSSDPQRRPSAKVAKARLARLRQANLCRDKCRGLAAVKKRRTLKPRLFSQAAAKVS